MKPLSIYIHIPFCEKKCNYCDFLSFPAGKDTQDAYLEALNQEIRASGERFSDRQVISIFFGGGTPSFIKREGVSRLMETLKDHFHVSQDAEVTLEMNPGSADKKKMQTYLDAGINRLSIGCQSLCDKELQLLGRVHNRETFLQTYADAREIGFDNINVDLMAALPGQTLESYFKTLEETAALKPEHISAYSLIIEEGTPFYGLYGPEAEEGETADALPLPDEETERRMYAETELHLQKCGYHRYEISNYARGPEGDSSLECRHNKVYWQRGDYLGLGIGSASLIDNQRFCNTRDLKTYVDANGNPESIRENFESLDIHAQMEEYMFLGLRMTRGISQEGFRQTFGHPIRRIYAHVLDHLRDQELLVIDGDRIYLTPLGLDVSNYALAQFLFD